MNLTPTYEIIHYVSKNIFSTLERNWKLTFFQWKSRVSWLNNAMDIADRSKWAIRSQWREKGPFGVPFEILMKCSTQNFINFIKINSKNYSKLSTMTNSIQNIITFSEKVYKSCNLKFNKRVKSIGYMRFFVLNYDEMMTS